jgi:hypothetical protein
MSIRVWTKEDVLELLNAEGEKGKRAVAKAIIALYARQTADEQSTKLTSVSNGRGFNKIDAPFLTDIAKKLPLYSMNLTPRQLTTARKMLRKYGRQLAEIANENEQARVERASVEQIVAAQQTEGRPLNPMFGRF